MIRHKDNWGINSTLCAFITRYSKDASCGTGYSSPFSNCLNYIGLKNKAPALARAW